MIRPSKSTSTTKGSAPSAERSRAGFSMRGNTLGLLIGGGAIINCGLLIFRQNLAAWQRYGGVGLCFALGLTSLCLGVVQALKKKPERPKFVSKKAKKSGP